jgi:hypothetical protein
MQDVLLHTASQRTHGLYAATRKATRAMVEQKSNTSRDNFLCEQFSACNEGLQVL